MLCYKTASWEQTEFLLSVKHLYKNLECVWLEELLRNLFQGDREGQGICLCDLSSSSLSSSAWAEKDSSCRAGCASHSGNLVASAPCSCHMRQSVYLYFSVTVGPGDHLLMLPISSLGVRPLFHPSPQQTWQIAQGPKGHILNSAF